MNDRKLGYIIIFLTFSIFISILGYGLWTILFPKNTQVILFDNLTNLQIDDAVKFKGNSIGRVVSVSHTEIQGHQMAVVTIVKNDDLSIHSDYAIVVTDKGIMGDRVILLNPGSMHMPVIDAKDTLFGHWIPSISDALGKAWKLKAKIREIRAEIGSLINEKEGKKSFVSQLNTLFVEIDAVTQKVFIVVDQLQKNVPPKIEALQKLSNSMLEFTENIDSTISEPITKTDNFLSEAIPLLNGLEDKISVLSTLVKNTKESKYLKEDQISAYHGQLNEIISLLKEIRIGIIAFRVVLVRD